MSARVTMHRRTGAQLDTKQTIYALTKCSCGATGEEPVDANLPVRPQLAELDCLICGRKGQIRKESFRGD